MTYIVIALIVLSVLEFIAIGLIVYWIYKIDIQICDQYKRMYDSYQIIADQYKRMYDSYQIIIDQHKEL